MSGGYALLCIPVVLLFERLGWDDSPLHVTQFLACIACAAFALLYLGRPPEETSHAVRILATVGLGLGCLWVLALIAMALLIGFSGGILPD